MFIAALFTIAKIWKQPKCPLRDEQTKMRCINTYTHTHTHTHTHTRLLLILRRNKVLLFATTYMDWSVLH